MKKLKDWLPWDHQHEDELEKYLECEVVSEFGIEDKHPFKHKNICAWCIFKKDKLYYACGWNENLSRGWSFPVKKFKSSTQVVLLMKHAKDKEQ